MLNGIASYHVPGVTGIEGSGRPDVRREKDRNRGGQSGLPSGSSQGAPGLGVGPAAASAQDQSLSELRQRDREVRSHEQAHKAAGGRHAGSPTYSYVRGPDNAAYAVSGEVSIDTAPVPGDPEATEKKAETVRAAALAPAVPSSQDQQVAARAAQLASKARMEKASAAYERAGGEKGLALWGTGISLSV